MAFRSISPFALLLLLASSPVFAQGAVQPVGVSDADALASAVRRLGANPLDLDALLTAGELSVRLDDLSAAGSFFARAEKLDPRSPRVKAGEGAILVRSQRPAEALRYFAQAEQFGLTPARFAADRGLAYDLIGDQGRAQRDYRLALGRAAEAETRRRLALSLAIAGRQTQALEELAPLIRQNDRAAWRTRAFVLAMGGNAGEASRIAQTMMPPGAAAGLAGFFVELPRLPAIDRAFAVHFGEVRPSPQRLADARFAPREAPLAVEAEPIRVAAVALPQDKKSRKRDRKRRGEVQVAAVLPAPVYVQPLPQPPAYQAPAYAPFVATTPVRDRPLSQGELASLSRAGVRSVTRVGRSGSPPAAFTRGSTGDLSAGERASLAAAGGTAPVSVVANTATAPIARQPLTRIAPAPAGVTPPLAATPAPVRVTATTALPPVATRPNAAPATGPIPVTAAASLALAPVTPGLADARLAPLITSAVASSVTAFVMPQPIQPAAAVVNSAPTASLAAVAPPASAAVGLAPASIAPPTVLASIAAAPVAGPPVPGDLAVAMPTVGAEPASVPTAPALTELAAVNAPAAATSAPPTALVTLPERAAAAVVRPGRRMPRAEADDILAKIVANLSIPASELEVTGPVRPVAGQGTSVADKRKAAADKALAEKKAAADKKLLADKKGTADKKALADKEAAAEKKLARSEPPRIWVQVAGGANEGDLVRAWRAARTKAPGALAERQGWTTPLRATNRVLAGPFKTDSEARTVVNQLAKAGVSAFTFTSEAGQKVTRLAAK
jgi:tetratricopeptide (TPR) repeat protein